MTAITIGAHLEFARFDRWLEQLQLPESISGGPVEQGADGCPELPEIGEAITVSHSAVDSLLAKLLVPNHPRNEIAFSCTGVRQKRCNCFCSQDIAEQQMRTPCLACCREAARGFGG
jgi:hypothetical protein